MADCGDPFTWVTRVLWSQAMSQGTVQCCPLGDAIPQCYSLPSLVSMAWSSMDDIPLVGWVTISALVCARQ